MRKKTGCPKTRTKTKTKPTKQKKTTIQTPERTSSNLLWGPLIWWWKNCASDPKIWTLSLRQSALRQHSMLKYCGPQCNISMAAEIDIAMFEWQTRRPHPQTASETSCIKKVLPQTAGGTFWVKATLQAKHLHRRNLQSIPRWDAKLTRFGQDSGIQC